MDDTCDNCGPAVRAYVYAERGERELTYCGHCGARFMPKLKATGWIVRDYRYLIGAS